MLKGLAILAVLILGLSIYVAIQDQRAAEQSARQSAKPSRTVASSSTQDEHGQQDTRTAKAISPSWHRIFAWPDGITAWAIILGLLAIVEQTSQTARAAKATTEAALKQAKFMIASERAWLLIRSVNEGDKITPGSIPIFRWELKNVGRTPARLLETQAVCRVEDQPSTQTMKETPRFPEPIPLNNRVLAPGDSVKFVTYWSEAAEDGFPPFKRPLEDCRPFRLSAYGYVKYLTVFSNEVRESRFCDDFVFNSDVAIIVHTQLPILFRPDLSAPDEYTDHT
jgi:hypothetical protein